MKFWFEKKTVLTIEIWSFKSGHFGFCKNTKFFAFLIFLQKKRRKSVDFRDTVFTTSTVFVSTYFECLVFFQLHFHVLL